MRHSITIPNGKRVCIRQYVAAIWVCKLNPEKDFSGWEWYPVKGRDIIAAFGRMVQDHCNRGLTIPAAVNMKAAMRRYRAGVEAHCRNCGTPFLRHNPNNANDRYCGRECRAA